MRNVPKIVFKEMSLDENIEIIKWAYFENNGLLTVHDYTIQYFPELANLKEDLKKDEIFKIIEEVVKKDYLKYKERIKEETKRYNQLWEKYNDIYFSELSKYLDINWPNNLEIIEATVGLIPTFPRYLDSFSFSISTGLDESKLIEVSAHETLHFLWFLKWRELYPETPRREYDSPYLTWQYSEMVTDPILNNYPFNNIFDFTEKGYDVFYELYDEDKLVMDNLRAIYNKNISINEKITKGFEYLNKIHKDKII